MAGKDDIRLLSSYVYSKARTGGVEEDEVHAIAATVMNRATALGSLPEAIQTMNPTPDVMDIMQGNIKSREQKEYKRTIQLTSKFLRGSTDVTGGAIELAPKRTKMDKSLGLQKTHATKNYNFYRGTRPPAGGMQGL